MNQWLIVCAGVLAIAFWISVGYDAHEASPQKISKAIDGCPAVKQRVLDNIEKTNKPVLNSDINQLKRDCEDEKRAANQKLILK